jgi:hypothetical protein
MALTALVWTSRARGDAATAATPPATPAATPATDPSAPSAATSEPLVVTIGIYLVSVYSFDQENNTYFADFYLWMRWRGDRDPTATIEILNNVERWGMTMTPINEAPIPLPGGEFRQEFHVQGEFFQPLSLDDYPLDEQALTIRLEDSTYVETEQIYVADLDQSGINPDLRLPGWTVTGWTMTTPSNRYESGFGKPDTSDAVFSMAQFTLAIERPPNYFRWKLLWPLLIVLMVGCSLLLVHPSYVEVRLAGPASAMLALIFLQQGYSSTLPEIGRLVLLDKIYVLAYALVIGLIATTIVTSHWVQTDGAAGVAKAERLDRIAVSSLFGLFLIGSLILVVPAL